MAKRIDYAQYSADTFKSLVALDKTLAGSPLGLDLIDLIKIRASQLNGCLYCVDMHTKEARLRGQRELKIHHLAFWRESELFTAREKAALEWTEGLTRIGAHGVETEDFQEARAVFSEKELSDLTYVIGSINFWNRIGVAFRPVPGSKDSMLGLDKAGL
ncbi:MAG: carboxymuconolactone decarboxylase family protein [Fibrobacteria bacterium]